MFTFACRMLYQICQGYLKPPVIRSITRGTDHKTLMSFPVSFRCYPIDWDVYLHMNNRNYFAVAELARWRSSAASGILQYGVEKGYMFLVVEQSIKYLRPIKPFEKFVVSTEVELLPGDKYMMYTHTFEKDLSGGKLNEKGKRPFAEIKMKAVVKEQNGKTVPASEIANFSPWSKSLIYGKERIDEDMDGNIENHRETKM